MNKDDRTALLLRVLAIGLTDAKMYRGQDGRLHVTAIVPEPKK